MDSSDIFDKKEYVNLLYDFSEEYESKGFLNIWWGVDSTLTQDNLTFFGNLNKRPKKKERKAVETQHCSRRTAVI
jgi:hypothetical protein